MNGSSSRRPWSSGSTGRRGALLRRQSSDEPFKIVSHMFRHLSTQLVDLDQLPVVSGLIERFGDQVGVDLDAPAGAVYYRSAPRGFDILAGMKLITTAAERVEQHHRLQPVEPAQLHRRGEARMDAVELIALASSARGDAEAASSFSSAARRRDLYLVMPAASSTSIHPGFSATRRMTGIMANRNG